MRSPEEWLPEIQAVLDELGVDAAIIGAVATIEYRSKARVTTDLDLLIKDLRGIKDAFEAHGFEVEEVRSQKDADPFLIILRKNGERTDLLIAETDYQKMALDKSKGTYLAPEDIIVHKLIAWRTRDREDIISILATGLKLDRAYIEHWANEWDVLSRWIEAQAWDLDNLR